MTYYRHLLAIAAVAIFFTSVHRYPPVYDLVLPVVWVQFLCVLSLPLLFNRKARANALRSPVTLWCFGYVLVTILWFFHSSQSDISWQEVRWRLLTITTLISFVLIFADSGVVRLARQTLVIAVLFGVALNIYELFGPLPFNEVPGRSAGLYLNPNQAGEALVMGMILSTTVLPVWFRIPFILLAGIGIFTTVSRGSIIVWLIAVSAFMLMRMARVKDLLLSVFLSLLLVAVVVLPRLDELLTTLERTGVSNKNVLERLNWFTDPTGISDNSSWVRKYLAKQAWEKIEDNPFIGSGTGSSREVVIGAHNQYLAFMQDHGLLGAAILPLFILAATWGARGEIRGLAITFGCAVFLLSFFSHTILNDEYSLVSFALMAAMVSTSRESEIAKTIVGEARGTKARRLRSVPQPVRSST